MFINQKHPLRTIGYDAFVGFSSLEIAKIQQFIKDIGDDAFPIEKKINDYFFFNWKQSLLIQIHKFSFFMNCKTITFNSMIIFFSIENISSFFLVVENLNKNIYMLSTISLDSNLNKEYCDRYNKSYQ